MPDTTTQVRDLSSRALGARWLKFNAVGVIGIAVQLAVLRALTQELGFGYLATTALAVEAAVLHNFVWHEHWTWREHTRSFHPWRSVLGRLARFHLANGVTSMLSNLAAIAATAVISFALSEWFVFSGRG